MLGPVQLRGASGEWRSPSRPQLRVLLAFLALSAGQVTPAGELVDVLWEDRAPPSARASLQILIVRLRKALAEVPDCVIERYGEGYRLHFSPCLADVHAFRSMVAAAREARDDQHAIAVLGQALALWRGPAVADVPSTMRVESIRSGLTEEHLSAVQDRFGRLLAADRDTEVAAEIPLMLARYPLAERLAGMLMTAWYRSGRRAEALHAFRDLRHRLVRELGVEPGNELQHLHQRMLSGDPGLAWPPDSPRSLLGVVNLAAPARSPRTGRRYRGNVNSSRNARPMVTASCRQVLLAALRWMPGQARGRVQHISRPATVILHRITEMTVGRTRPTRPRSCRGRYPPPRRTLQAASEKSGR